MKRNGCLLSFLAVFIGFLSLYAANVLDDDKLKTPDYYEVTVRGMFKQGRWAEGKTLGRKKGGRNSRYKLTGKEPLIRTMLEQGYSKAAMCRRLRCNVKTLEGHMKRMAQGL